MLGLIELRLTDCQSSYFASVALLTSLKSQAALALRRNNHIEAVNKQPLEPAQKERIKIICDNYAIFHIPNGSADAAGNEHNARMEMLSRSPIRMLNTHFPIA